MSKYEHAPEAVGQMRERLQREFLLAPTGYPSGYERQARLVLDRERILTEALRAIREAGAPLSQERAAMALRDLAAYDAPAPSPAPLSTLAMDLSSRLVGARFTEVEAAYLSREIAMRTHAPAPKEPTLLEAAKALVNSRDQTTTSAMEAMSVLRAAIEREEGGAK